MLRVYFDYNLFMNNDCFIVFLRQSTFLVVEVISRDGFTLFGSSKASYRSATANGAFPVLMDKSCNETMVVVVLLDPPLPLFPTIFCVFTNMLSFCIIYLNSNRLFVGVNSSKCLVKEA